MLPFWLDLSLTIPLYAIMLMMGIRGSDGYTQVTIKLPLREVPNCLNHEQEKINGGLYLVKT